MADLRSHAFSFLAYRPHVSPVAWAEANLQLSALVTEAPGPYSTRLHPYVREPLDTFADNTTSDLVLCWGSQTAKTTTISAGLLYRFIHGPTPALFAFPSKELAQSFSETRLAPLFDGCEALARLKPKNRSKFKKTEWQLDTCNVAFVGSNSAANLASRPIGLLLADEIDQFHQGSAKETSAINLAVERTKAFASAKRVFTSTPTLQSGEIWTRYLRGDQRKYFCPCPHCNELIDLQWGQVKWDHTAKDEKTEAWDYPRVLASAHYECQKCHGKIEDHHKTKMLWGGRWIPTNPGARPGWKSYHLSSLYSVSLTFGKLAIKWLDAQESVTELQGFINGYLAEPWEDRAIKNTEETLTPLLGTTERGTFDATDGGHNLMAVDVQQGYFAWVCRRFYAGNKSQLVDWGMAAGYPDLDTIQAKYGAAYLAIDSSEGARAAEVYRECAQRAGSWTAIKGGVMSDFLRPVQIDPYMGGKQAGQMTITLLHVNDPQFSDELLARLSGKIAGWKLTKSIDIIYQKQILAVFKSERKKRSGAIEVKIKSKGAEHLFDCEKLLLAFSIMFGLGPRIERPAANNPETSRPAPAEGRIVF